MTKELHTEKFHLQTNGWLYVYDHKLATKINKYLKFYENGKYRFKAGEEARFIVPQIKINEVRRAFLEKKRV